MDANFKIVDTLKNLLSPLDYSKEAEKYSTPKNMDHP